MACLLTAIRGGRITSQLNDKGIGFVVTDQDMDISTPTGRLLLNLLGILAEFENEIRKERQMDGINRAKAEGKRFGPKPKLTAKQVEEMVARKDANLPSQLL